jgi:hypothetical protein
MRLGTVILALAFCLTAPIRAEAQPAAKVYRIGLLSTFSGSRNFETAFVRGLRDHGYVEGQNLQIERRYSEGKSERLPALVAELIDLRVSLIVTSGPGPSRAAKDATEPVNKNETVGSRV